MSNSISAAPFLNLQGIRDDSIRAPVQEPEQVPTHLPHVFLFAEKGPEISLASGGVFQTLFGSKTLDSRSAYYNHQSELAATVMGAGNSIFVQRLKPADAGPNARLLISLDVVADQIQQYERNPDGSFKLGTDGNKIPLTGGAAKIAGTRGKFVINDWTAGSTVQPFGEVTAKVGSITSSADAQSTVYPILELEANFFGAYGNNLGLRLTAPTLKSAVTLNSDLVESVKAYVYRLSLVNRLDESSTVNISPTLGGDQSIDFAFKEGAVDPSSDT